MIEQFSALDAFLGEFDGTTVELRDDVLTLDRTGFDPTNNDQIFTRLEITLR